MAQTIRRAMAEVVELRRRLRQRPVRTARGECCVEAEDGLAERLSAAGASGWSCVKTTERVSVHRRERPGEPDVYRKRFLAVRWRDRLTLWFRRPRAWANYRVAQRLALRGFATVPHGAAMWRGAPGGGIESTLLTTAVEGAVPLDRWVRTLSGSASAVRRAAAMAGRWLAAAHENWVIPHDLKASNLLVRPAAADDLILLDLDNCAARRPVLTRDIVRNFAQFRRSFEHDLGFAEWLRFCVAYGRARGWSTARLRHVLAKVERRARRRGMRNCAPATRGVGN